MKKYLLILCLSTACYADITDPIKSKTSHKNKEIYTSTNTFNFETDVLGIDTMYNSNVSFTLKPLDITSTFGITYIDSSNYYPYISVMYSQTFFDFNISMVTQIQTNAFTDVEMYYNPSIGYIYKNYTLNIGPYYADRYMTGDVNTLGFSSVFTCDWDDIDLSIQYISGNNSVSIISATLAYAIKEFQPYIGFNYATVEAPYSYMSFGINWQ